MKDKKEKKRERLFFCHRSCWVYLFQMAFGSAEKDDGEIACRSGSDGRQKNVVHDADGPFDDWFASAQRCIDVQSTKVLSDRLQFLKEKIMKKKINEMIRSNDFESNNDRKKVKKERKPGIELASDGRVSMANGRHLFPVHVAIGQRSTNTDKTTFDPTRPTITNYK